MIKRQKMIWAIGSVLGIVLIVIGWWLLSPLWIDRVVNEAAPVGAVTKLEKSEATVEDATNDETIPNSAIDDTEKPIENKPAVQSVMLTGTFSGADKQHQVEGTANILEADGKIYVRLEQFEATNGPDLFVYLAQPGGVVKDGINLGELKGNIGDQNYELPEGVDLGVYSRVVIYCKAFSVVFGSADLM